MKKYFYTDGQTKFGPFSLEELLEKNISWNTKVWFYGLNSWIPFSEVEELKDHLVKIPPPINQPPPIPDSTAPKIDLIKSDSLETKPKSKWVNIAVAFFIIALIVLAVWVVGNENSGNTIVKGYEEIKASAFDSDEDFTMYLDKFYRDLNVYGIYPKKPNEVIIKFAKLDQITDATHVHAYSFGGQKDELIEIYINPSSWEKFNKPKRYFLMYHELAHDILNLEDLSASTANIGKLMYPNIESYERLTMDQFIESYQELFEEVTAK